MLVTVARRVTLTEWYQVRDPHETAGMRTGRIINTILSISILVLPGCATRGPVTETDHAGNPLESVDSTQADPQFDHVFAWIPQDRARTASVAEALVHIELGRAKEKVGKALCGGSWPINGARVASSGPYPATAPAALGGYPAWYYHSSHEPGFTGCAAVPTATLYRALDDRLPLWIRVEAAVPPVSAASVTGVSSTSISR
jgi:hypothetical protein